MKTLILCIALISSGLLRANDTLTISLEVAQMNSTEKVYNLQFDDFDHVIVYQFGLSYDTSGMAFREVRAITLDHLLPQHFNEPFPGDVRNVFLNPTLQPIDYSNPVIAYQLVFDLKVPGGSDLCFSTDALKYEFGLVDGTQTINVSHVILYDDCHQPFVLGLEGSTATDQIGTIPSKLISNAHLSQAGQLMIEAEEATDVRLTILDANAQLVADLGQRDLTVGRQEMDAGNAFVPGVYILVATGRSGVKEVVKLAVQ